jgi:Clostridium epsilon toxin ETX/Bacillus mosquitocidal toxin MTX2
MALQTLDATTVGQHIATAWMEHFAYWEDPANGAWYTTGPNGDGIGLYGGLTDTPAAGLVFDQSNLTFLPRQFLADSAIVDNRNGLAPHSVMNLSYTHSSSTTTTHTTTHSVNTSASVDISAGIDFIVKAETDVKFSVNYTFNYTSTTSTTTSDSQTFSQSLPIDVPKGRVYKGVLLATAQSIDVPFTATIAVDGTSETWYANPVLGHYNWTVDAGTLFGWIAQFGTAGSDSAQYRNLGNGHGGLVVSGVLHSEETVNFQARVYDVTDAPSTTGQVLARASASLGPDESPVPGGTLVSAVNC